LSLAIARGSKQGKVDQYELSAPRRPAKECELSRGVGKDAKRRDTVFASNNKRIEDRFLKQEVCEKGDVELRTRTCQIKKAGAREGTRAKAIP
jgi:hypothetical protein